MNSLVIKEHQDYLTANYPEIAKKYPNTYISQSHLSHDGDQRQYKYITLSDANDKVVLYGHPIKNPNWIRNQLWQELKKS